MPLGGLISGIGAKKAAKQQQKFLTEAAGRFDPQVAEGRAAGGFLSQLLGTAQGTGGGEALQRFRELSGFRNALSRDAGAVGSSAAARGVLGSSGAARQFAGAELDRRGSSLQGFLAQLLGQQKRGDDAVGDQADILAKRPANKGLLAQNVGSSISRALETVFGRGS